MAKKQPIQYPQEVLNFLNKLKKVSSIKKKNINFFTVTKMLTLETKHSAFLAWLLDSHECHYLGKLFLEQFFEQVYDFQYPLPQKPNGLRDNSSIINKTRQDFLDLLQDDTYLTVETEKQTANGKSIDILIDIPVSKTVIVIENKLFSKTHSNQLKEYEDYIDYDDHFKGYDNKFFIYLTPGGEKDEDYLPMNQSPKAYNGRWCIISYDEIEKIVESILHNIPTSVKEKNKLKTILKDYIELINYEVLKMNKTDMWNLISDKGNKPILREVYEAMKNKEEILKYCREYLKQRCPDIDFWKETDGTLHFITKNMIDYCTKNQIDYKNKDAKSQYSGPLFCGSDGTLKVAKHLDCQPAIKAILDKLSSRKSMTLLTNEEWISPLDKTTLDPKLDAAVDLIDRYDQLFT